MVIPEGERYQQMLYLLTKKDGKMVSEALQATMFVPMTGKAEAGRQLLPDPTKPTAENGGFESVTGDPPKPVGWYYERQLKIVAGDDAPEGKNYITFTNTSAGRPSQARQAFAVDGRKVPALQLSAQVRGKDIRPGQNPQQLPGVVLAFYDENRVPVPLSQGGEAGLGPWQGTFGWQHQTKRISVPPKAREGFLTIGLLGAVGEISFDAVELKAAKK